MTDLKPTMDDLCGDIGKDIYKLKTSLLKAENLIDYFIKDLNSHTNFDQLELIEEKMDEMIFNYEIIKTKFRKGRYIRYNMEESEKNENKCEINILQCCRIKDDTK